MQPPATKTDVFAGYPPLMLCQIEALRDYATSHGTDWREDLRRDWLDIATDPALRRLRGHARITLVDALYPLPIIRNQGPVLVRSGPFLCRFSPIFAKKCWRGLVMTDFRLESLPANMQPGVVAALRGGSSIAAFVRGLAEMHGVSFASSPIDRFAASAARLSDAAVESDDIEDLLVALQHAGHISAAESMALQAVHLRQIAG